MYDKSKFNKDKLPAPAKLIEMLKIKWIKNHKGYFMVVCPFHEDGTNQKKFSLHMHHEDGYFKCHECGEKGSNVLSFYMRVKGLDFTSAVKELGAWDDEPDIF